MVNRASIDGQDFYSVFGVVVESISGELDPLKLKTPTKRDWPDEHGDDVYLDQRYYESRSIQIACYIEGEDAEEYRGKIKTFFNALTSPKARYLKVFTNSLGYLVYMTDCSTVTRMTAVNSGRVIGKFTLTLSDYCPVNRQFFAQGATASILISCSRPLTIWWGDGTSEYVVGTNQNKSKNYGSAADRYIVIFGPVETITALTPTGSTEIT